MQHKLQLANEVMLFKEVRSIEVVNIVHLDQKLLSLFESVLNLKVFDEFWIQRIFDHFGLSNFEPLVTNYVI